MKGCAKSVLTLVAATTVVSARAQARGGGHGAGGELFFFIIVLVVLAFAMAVFALVLVELWKAVWRWQRRARILLSPSLGGISFASRRGFVRAIDGRGVDWRSAVHASEEDMSRLIEAAVRCGLLAKIGMGSRGGRDGVPFHKRRLLLEVRYTELSCIWIFRGLEDDGQAAKCGKLGGPTSAICFEAFAVATAVRRSARSSGNLSFSAFIDLALAAQADDGGRFWGSSLMWVAFFLINPQWE